MKNIAVFGATGAIGNAFCQQLAQMYPAATIHAIARQTVAFDLPNVYTHTLDFEDEDALQALMDGFDVVTVDEERAVLADLDRRGHLRSIATLRVVSARAAATI